MKADDVVAKIAKVMIRQLATLSNRDYLRALDLLEARIRQWREVFQARRRSP